MKNGPYELVIAPEGYPGKKYRDRYVYQHHLVWWQHTGYLVKDDEIIHHSNKNKRDNCFENLCLMTNKQHCEEHSKYKSPTYLVYMCPICYQTFKFDQRSVRGRGEYPCCSRRCAHRIITKDIKSTLFPRSFYYLGKATKFDFLD